MAQITLDQLPVGAAAVITHLHGTGAIRRRLLDLGFLPGTRLAAELRSPLGDPTAYRIREALIALRRDQARDIDIETESESETENAAMIDQPHEAQR